MSATYPLYIPPGQTLRQRIEWKTPTGLVDTTGYQFIFNLSNANGDVLWIAQSGMPALTVAGGIIDLWIDWNVSGNWNGQGTFFLESIAPNGDRDNLLSGVARFSGNPNSRWDGGVIIVENEKVGVVSSGLQGPPGIPGTFSHAFYFGDATPAPVMLVKLGQTVFRVIIELVQAFDGLGAQLSIGFVDDPVALVEAIEVDMGHVASYEFSVNWTATKDTMIYLYIIPGDSATCGHGFTRLIFGG